MTAGFGMTDEPALVEVVADKPVRNWETLR